jgi:hypothetical protein
VSHMLLAFDVGGTHDQSQPLQGRVL